jgi:hypothetical protein
MEEGGRRLKGIKNGRKEFLCLLSLMGHVLFFFLQ